MGQWTQTFLTQLLSCQVSNKRNEDMGGKFKLPTWPILHSCAQKMEKSTMKSNSLYRLSTIERTNPAAFYSLCKAVSNMILSSWSMLFCLEWYWISILKFYKWGHSMQVPIGFLGTDSSRKREVSSDRTAKAHWRPRLPGADYKKD